MSKASLRRSGLISLADLTPELEAELYSPHTKHQREVQARAALVAAGLLPPQPLTKRQQKRRRAKLSADGRESVSEFIAENPGCGVSDVLRAHPHPGFIKRAVLWLLAQKSIIYCAQRNPESQEPGLCVPKAKNAEPKKPRAKLGKRAAPRSKPEA